MKTFLARISAAALTADGWSNFTRKKYFAVTIQTIIDWKVVSFVLVLRAVASETAQRCADVVTLALAEYEVPWEKITAMVTDNAANMVKCVELVQKPRIGCFAHITQLLIAKLVSVRFRCLLIRAAILLYTNHT